MATKRHSSTALLHNNHNHNHNNMVKVRRKNKASLLGPGGRLHRILMLGLGLVVTAMVLPQLGDDGGYTNTMTITTKKAATEVSYQTPLAYGTKSGGTQTAELVEQAIKAGFRHIVTGGHHASHNETGVGYGWKASGIQRQKLFLQTCFVPWDGTDFQNQPKYDPKTKPSTIEDQVKLSIETSLQNLQTEYIDAVVFHNFRAKLFDFDQTMKAWRILEEYVAKGTIRYLGATSVHNQNRWQQWINASKIPPTILQNRFHSNRQYDVQNQHFFYHPTTTTSSSSPSSSSLQSPQPLQLQRFWLLNGSSGQGGANKEMAKKKGITPQQLMLGFVMSLGKTTCLVGTHNLQHMKDDIVMSKCYPYVFDSQEERIEYATKLRFKPSDWSDYAEINNNDDDNAAAFKVCEAKVKASLRDDGLLEHF